MVSRMKGVLNSPPLTLLPGGRNYQSDQENKSSQRTRTLGREDGGRREGGGRKEEEKEGGTIHYCSYSREYKGRKE